MVAINAVKTGMRIKELRAKAGLSVSDVQDVFGFSTPQAIYKWQQGVALPTIDNLVVLSSIFEVPIEDIIVLERER